MAIALSGADVYVGGRFTRAGGVEANGLARWDGTAWHAVGTGLNGEVPWLSSMTMTIQDGSLVAAWEFSPPTRGTSGLARWDGTSLRPLGSGVESISSLAVFGQDLYAGGRFNSAGERPANMIARWDGTTWRPLGDGLAGTSWTTYAGVAALAVQGEHLVAVGTFITAGGKPSFGIARWTPALEPKLVRAAWLPR